MMRTLTKLVTKAKNAGHSLIRPWDSEPAVPAGSRSFKASNVIANANTPSLNASIRTVSFSSIASRSIMRFGPEGHAWGRFEYASQASSLPRGPRLVHDVRVSGGHSAITGTAVLGRP